MGLMKRWLETLSEEMGYEGEINEMVLEEGDKQLASLLPPELLPESLYDKPGGDVLEDG